MPLPRGPHSSPRIHRLLQTLEGHLDERPGVKVLGTSDSGIGSDVTLTFRANRHTPYVYVQVQSDNTGEGGEGYDPNNYASRTRYTTISEKQHSDTITRDDDAHYYAYVIPAVQIPPGCGSDTLYDGVNADDHMEFVDLGKRTVGSSELEANVLANLVEEDQQESDFDSDGTLEGRLTLTVLTTQPVDIEFYTRQGSGTSWTSASTFSSKSSGDTVQQDVDLVEGKLSFIAYKILEAGTTTSLGRAVRAFDPDKIAQMRHLGLSLDLGVLKAEAAGESDTVKIYLTRTFDGSEPADPTSGNADQTINARSGSVTFTGTLAVNSTARVKARGENANGVLAPADTILADSIERVPQDSTQNLLGQDAGPEKNVDNAFDPDWLVEEPIANLGLEVGDVISAGVSYKSATGAEDLSVRIVFHDSGGSNLSTEHGTVVSGSSYTRSVLEDVTIPANTASITFSTRDQTNTEQHSARRAMLNRGPIAHSFVEPPTRTERGEVSPAFDWIELQKIEDDGTDDTYFLDWQVNAAVGHCAAGWRVKVFCYRSGSLATRDTFCPDAGPVQVTASGDGDGAGDTHYARFELYQELIAHAGNREYANQESAELQSSVTGGTAPSNLSASMDSGDCEVDLAWDPDTLNSQDVYRCEGADCDPTVDGSKVADVPAGTSSHSDPVNGISSGTTLRYEILSSAGQSNAAEVFRSPCV